jgi:hypothetical protein
MSVLPLALPATVEMNDFGVIDRCEGTMAGCSASNVAAGPDDEVGPAARASKEGCDGES